MALKSHQPDFKAFPLSWHLKVNSAAHIHLDVSVIAIPK